MIVAVAIGAVVGVVPTRYVVGRLELAPPAGHVLAFVLDGALGAGVAVAGHALDGEATAVAALIAALAARSILTIGGPREMRALGLVVGGSLVLWPPGLVVLAALAILWVRAVGAPIAIVIAVVGYVIAAIVWAATSTDTWWGVTPDDLLVWLAIGVAAGTLPGAITEIVERA